MQKISLTHLFGFNKTAYEVAKFIDSYRTCPGQQILPESYQAVSSEDGLEKVVVYFYTNPAHFQTVMLFHHKSIANSKDVVWLPYAYFTRRLRHDEAIKTLPAEMKKRLISRVKKRAVKNAA